MPAVETNTAPPERTFRQGLGLVDSTMLVAGSMIGSGIFIVSADIARQVGSAGWLLAVWLVTGVLTVSAALCYGELAAMMPRAGGKYVYLREAYGPLWGFLYGWTFFLVIQTGIIAAVAVAFARFFGVVAPAISPTAWIVPPINVSANYAVSLSTQQCAAMLIIILLSFINSRGLQIGRLIQNFFTSAKTLALLGLVLIGLLLAHNPAAIKANFSDLWTPRGVTPVSADLPFVPSVSATAGAFGLLVAFCVAQVGSLFSSDAWYNVTFTAAEVKNPRRQIPIALAAGTGLVTMLYLLANLSYLCLLPLDQIQNAPDDRVATAAIEPVFSGAGPAIMAVAIMVSTFGCNNGLILAGARVYYAMARDGLFFRAASRLNDRGVPGFGLGLQCLWACLLVLPRTRLHDGLGAPKLDPLTGAEVYGNLYSNLLDYVVFAVLIFYVLTIFSLFVLRRKRPDAPRPYRAIGYPVVPALYIASASLILLVLLLYRTQTTWPGLLIVLAGVPAYLLWHRRGGKAEERAGADWGA